MGHVRIIDMHSECIFGSLLVFTLFAPFLALVHYPFLSFFLWLLYISISSLSFPKAESFWLQTMVRGLGSSSLITLEEKNVNLKSSTSTSSSSVVTFEETNDNLLFGVSCAFFALGNLFSNPSKSDGNFDLILALLVWKTHKERLKLEDAERSIEELKARRRDDARANEKAVGMFATREQSWFSERKNLQRQIGALQHELSVVQENSQKTAFIELVSKQRQLEDAKQELESLSKQKEESIFMVHKLSMELMKIRKDLEQKDYILSAMLRKSKLDTAEKQLLLKEIKLSKAKRRQAEIETERWKTESPDHKNESEFISQDHTNELETEAFAEQMRLKDEKLEACRSLLLRMEMESKRLQAHIEGLEYNQSHLRKDNMKLEWFLKKQLEFPNHQNQIPDPELSQDTIWLRKKKESFHVYGKEMQAKSKPKAFYLDLHALGVSYKIKRLKHQIHMLEKLTTGKQQDDDDDTALTPKTLLSLLSKQVNRYQSLQAKIDELSKRISHHKECSIEASELLSKEERKSVEHLMAETFKLQRYIVATGQRLIEIQSKIAYGFVGTSTTIIGFDMKRFAENVKTIFRKVQRSLDVRISRVIGDLEGTLSGNGMKRL